MATVFKPGMTVEQANGPALVAFLAALGDLSRKHGIALTDGASLYVMEQEDFARSYLATDESELTFA